MGSLVICTLFVVDIFWKLILCSWQEFLHTVRFIFTWLIDILCCIEPLSFVKSHLSVIGLLFWVNGVLFRECIFLYLHFRGYCIWVLLLFQCFQFSIKVFIHLEKFLYKVIDMGLILSAFLEAASTALVKLFSYLAVSMSLLLLFMLTQTLIKWLGFSWMYFAA